MTVFNLQKRVAFMTGGSGGIGLGMAKGLASSGAAVVIGGRNQTKAKSALSELHSLGAQAEFVELDVSDGDVLSSGDRACR
jgi:2-deoxy-D-gluconate 3-dehydrogenase